MKRCPTCQKEFPDSMRFCQTDGTPLNDTPAAPADDPFKTVVGQPPTGVGAMDDPFKTVVGGMPAGMSDQSKDDDILQLPNEPLDPMKTMVVSPADLQKEMSSSSGTSTGESSVPEPPKFKEPDLNPPSFGDLSPQKPSSTGDIFGSGLGNNSSSSSPLPPLDLPDKPQSSSGLPFGQPPTGSPFQSPFEEQKSSFEPPSPFDAPAASSTPPFDAPKPPPFKEPESPFGGQSSSSPFDQSPFQPPPQSPFGQGSSSSSSSVTGNLGGSSDPFANQSVQGDWNPPPAPMQNWQDQNLGTNTPFQPPGATEGQNNTLGIVSLVLGVLGFVCLGPLGAIPAIITGYMQRNNIRNNPSEYGGSGMAMAGMILGGIYLALFVVIMAIYIMLILSSI